MDSCEREYLQVMIQFPIFVPFKAWIAFVALSILSNFTKAYPGPICRYRTLQVPCSEKTVFMVASFESGNGETCTVEPIDKHQRIR